MNKENEANDNILGYVEETADSTCSCSQSESECAPQRWCGKVVDAKTEPGCENTPVVPKTIDKGLFVTKIPIVLAEANVSIPIMAELKLEDNAIEIKRIKKNVYVTQCHLLPTDPCDTTGTLFIEGFIRKNIEYATEECSNDEVICGRIKHCTFKVPFKCTTTVCFFRKPVLRGPIFLQNPPTTEAEIFQDTLKSCDVCREPVIGKDPCQQNFKTTEFFNEPIFCELVKAIFNEADIHNCPQTSCTDPTEQSFRKITEKVLLTLKIKVLQKQQVALNAEDLC
ncbi:CsxC family protein [Clostridium magnum]|uniref:DUF7852 domain-containing protein n=1 Tax=Clostridium magnum DSM 2767 TaxID=1121326 RepID=A0A161WHP0_9CLOT|nr:hypothetical protein [Clostridium magnum]KZL91205.1 hypothetical protein CLMAG_29630 [Clostridium magnum DSM 2767]SHI32663.1 hypothetical protein SAMN02745944_04120 [Clostridium magnum DSM 2767]